MRKRERERRKPHKFENNTNCTGHTQRHPVIKSTEIKHTSKRMEVVFVCCILHPSSHTHTGSSRTAIKRTKEKGEAQMGRKSKRERKKDEFLAIKSPVKR